MLCSRTGPERGWKRGAVPGALRKDGLYILRSRSSRGPAFTGGCVGQVSADHLTDDLRGSAKPTRQRVQPAHSGGTCALLRRRRRPDLAGERHSLLFGWNAILFTGSIGVLVSLWVSGCSCQGAFNLLLSLGCLPRHTLPMSAIRVDCPNRCLLSSPGGGFLAGTGPLHSPGRHPLEKDLRGDGGLPLFHLRFDPRHEQVLLRHAVPTPNDHVHLLRRTDVIRPQCHQLPTDV